MASILSIVSGGIDSVTMAYRLQDTGYVQKLLFFDYGQKNYQELQYAALCAKRLGVDFMQMGIREVFKHIKPKGDVIPNRNAIMLSIAFGIAVSNGFDAVGMGVHSSDAAFLDCSSSFIAAFRTMEYASLGWHTTPALYVPYLHLPKARIVMEGMKLNVPYEDTWSCYQGGDYHCGVCSACVGRVKAFALAGIPDPTCYSKPLR